MHLAPKPGHVYRRTDSKQLIGAEGFEADVCDLDIVRALECGDLVPAKPAAAAPRKPKSKAKAAPAALPPAEPDKTPA